MSNFEKGFKEILGFEGIETTNNPNDKGGLTKFGISQKAFPKVDIRNLTLEGAKKIYFDNYWKTPLLNLDQYDEKTAIELFDIAVNMGVGTAAMTIQRAVNLMNRNQKDFLNLNVDGRAGDKTVRAYSKVNKEILLKVLNGLQFSRYVSIVERDETQEEFFNGWMVRV
jgi:lysozyme family protein